MNAVTEHTPPTAIEAIESILIRGDLNLLSTEQRVAYVNMICKQAGLNPLTRPFIFMQQQGKTVLYATKDCADQLRKLNGISIEIIGNEVKGGLLIVTAKATDRNGRTDQDYGATSVGGLTGEPAANAVMKAITKAKRRVTLSISGYGFADGGDTEADGDLIDSRANEAPKEKPKIAPKLPETKPDPQPPASETRVESAAAGPSSPLQDDLADADVTERVPHTIARKGDSATAWSLWGQEMIRAVREAPTAAAIDAWMAANHDHMLALEAYDKGKFTKLVKLVEAERAKKAPKDE